MTKLGKWLPYAVLWLLFLVCGTLLLLHVAGTGVGFDEAMLEIASALGNVGLSAGIIRPELPWLGKLTLILMMWMGRLEIIPVLVFLAGLLPRRRQHYP